MPKAKPDQVVIHRIEFQEREREMLEMIAASITAKNIGQTVNATLSPITKASVAGVAWSIALLSAFTLSQSEKAQSLASESVEGALWDSFLGPFWSVANGLSDDRIKNKFSEIMENISDRF